LKDTRAHIFYRNKRQFLGLEVEASVWKGEKMRARAEERAWEGRSRGEGASEEKSKSAKRNCTQ
jgi:hypothetical protein